MTMYTKRFILALLVIIGVFGYIFVITLCPGAKQDDTITGALLTVGFASILGFYFGSSDKKGKADEIVK